MALHNAKSGKPKKAVTEIPIFPLPNAVFFPKTLLPLHVFEARYRAMVEDVLTGDNRIGIVLLKDGWEQDYFGNPAVHDIACVGEIQNSERLEDSKYNILLYGTRRVRILKFVQKEPYRIAEVEYLRDFQFQADGFNEGAEVQDFIALVRQYLQALGVEDVDELLKLQSHSLESIVNQVATMLDFSSLEKQSLLEISLLEERFRNLKRMLTERLTSLRVARNVRFVPDDPSWN
jgi:Lon protease-like protein